MGVLAHEAYVLHVNVAHEGEGVGMSYVEEILFCGLQG